MRYAIKKNYNKLSSSSNATMNSALTDYLLYVCCFSSVCVPILRVVCCEIHPPGNAGYLFLFLSCFFYFFLFLPIILCLLLYRELLFVPRYLNGSHVLQLGGVSENVSYEFPQLQHKHFTGCIRNLLVDSKVQWGACFKLAKHT